MRMSLWNEKERMREREKNKNENNNRKKRESGMFLCPFNNSCQFELHWHKQFSVGGADEDWFFIGPLECDAQKHL